MTFDRILSCTKHASDQLQSSNIDLASAADLIMSTKTTLKDYRSELMWSKIYTYVEGIANMHSIEKSPHNHLSVRHRKPPQHLQSSIVLESTGSREPITCCEEYRSKFFFPILDTFISELGKRFDDKNISIMRAIQACNPNSTSFLSVAALQPLIVSYDLSVEEIEMEAILAKRTLENKNLAGISDVLLSLLPLVEAFPNLVKLIRIAMTIAVSTAQCERTFSTLKLVKSYLRSTMGETRLTDLAVLSIEKELSCNINFDEVVTEFAGVDKNRRIILV